MSSARYVNESALDPAPGSSWGKLLELVPHGSRVLDVGCGHGAFADAMRRLRGCRVTGVERNAEYAADARSRCDELLVGDVAELLACGTLRAEYEVVVAADVLEHLVDPATVLAHLRGLLAPGGVLLASVPNVTHLSVVACLAAGRFPRSPEGLLDDSHLQFYGRADLLALFARAGFAARVADRVIVDPRLTEFRTDLRGLPAGLLEHADRNPDATTYQFVVRAVPEAWAGPEDREAPQEPSAGAGGLRTGLSAELAETERKLSEFHARVGAYHEAVVARDRELAARDGELAARGRDLALLTELRSPARARAAASAVSARFRELRILYVADRDDAPYRYRCVHAIEQLRDVGVVANLARLDDPDLLDRLGSYSLVVLFRLAWSGRVAEVVGRAREGGAAIAFDVDDLIFDPSFEPLLPFVPRLGDAEVDAYRRVFAGLGRTLDAADFAIVTTEVLARHARARGKPALVHPNLLSPDHVALARIVYPLRRRLMRQPLVAYLSGSNTHDGDLGSVAEGIAAALRRRPELSLVLAGFIELPAALAPLAPRILRVPYLDHRLYPWVMARCRAVLAPIEEINDFTNAKSSLKVFEGGAFGVPAIVSPTVPYTAAVEHGVSGFVATTPGEWADAIAALADDRTSRRMGRAARAIALAHHTPRAWRGVLAHALVARAGSSSGPAPSLLPLRPTEAHPVRAGLRLARKSAKLALRLPATAMLLPPVPAPKAAALVREVATTPRRGRELVRDQTPTGLVVVDRERSLLALEMIESQETLVLAGPGSTGNAVAFEHCDPRFALRDVDVPCELNTLVAEVRAQADRPLAHLQLFWCPDGKFREEQSVKADVPADGRWHALAVRLPAPMAPGRYAVRLDPLDVPGQVEVGVVALLADAEPRGAGAPAFRAGLAARFLSGHGLEIGALQNPLSLPQGVTVRYVDRLTRDEARAHYPELADQALVAPSVIAEADRLAAVPTGSEDFVVCNHVLEHMRDPLGALREWLRVLRPGGHLYVSVPNGENPLDGRREPTTFEHLLADSRGERPDVDRAHYDEWTESVHGKLSPEARALRSEALAREGYSIHFHVFNRSLFERVLGHACAAAGAELVELQDDSQTGLVEHVAVLRKRGDSPSARPVDVVIPVYNAREYTRRCVESVLRHATGDWRLVLVHDVSTDPGVGADLREVARANARVVLLENERNLGFVATANRGMREAGGRDVLLLNSDTEVFEGFLDRMRAAIDADPRTGILTPFSNNATICSVPEFPHDNPIPAGYTPERFARLVTACSRQLRPEIPTGVGFCMWIRAEVLERIGYFDEETFGRGYGEENDLCQRARKSGFTVRLCDDVFVYHKGKASFGEEGKQLESLANSSAKALETKHPGYHAEIARFVESNPLSPLHEVIRFHLPRLRPGAEKAILYVLHASPWSERPGGTEHHVKDLLRELRLPRAVVAWPEGETLRAAEVLSGEVEAPTLYSFPFGRTPGAQRSLAARIALRRAIDLLGISAAHVHHLLSWPRDIAQALEDADVPFVWTHHDYYAVCPNWNLYDYERHEPCACDGEGAGCLASFSKATGFLADVDLALERRRHREAMDRALAAASAHVFPSRAALEVFERHLGVAGPRRVVIEHGHDAVATAERPPAGPRLRVALTGEIAYAIKGAERYLELLARTRELPLEWHVFGDTRPAGFGDRLAALGLGDRLVLHGRYQRQALPDLLRREGIELCVLLPNWDETFSYVLSEALLAGVPALTSTRGAIAQRIAACGAGRAVESVDEAARELAELCGDRDRLAAWTERARAHRHRPVAASAEEHRALYEGLGWFREAPLEPWDAPALVALHAVASPPRAPTGETAVPRRRAVLAALSAIRRPFQSVRLRTRHADWQNLAPVRRTWRGWSLEALTADPQMVLRASPVSPREVRALAFRLRHELAQETVAQLFWVHRDGEPFSEAKSAAVRLGPGDGVWRTYVIRLDTPRAAPLWMAGESVARLRLDPISTVGTFDIGGIVLRG